MVAIVSARYGFTSVDIINKLGGLVSRRRFKHLAIALLYVNHKGVSNIRFE